MNKKNDLRKLKTLKILIYDNILSHGVMAAQQVLVLFVQVRILVVQPKESSSIISMGFFYAFF